MKICFWFKVCRGKKGKKFYVLSKRFWNWIITEKKKCKDYGSKAKLKNKIINITNNKISERTIDNWIYRINERKPIIIENIPKKISNSGCKHGFNYFCPLCKLNKQIIENSPVKSFLKTNKKGKIYVFEDYWKEFIYFTKNCEAYGILPSQIKGIVNIDGRELRAWKNQNKVPKLYNKNEFEFTKENLYWLGLHYSDGYLRNNGSKFSFTWQQNSSNPFQGYWFPQFIQTYFDIFKHKQKRSMTYIKLQKGNWGFVNNLSGISPIFILAMKNENIISKRNKTKISGYSKIFSSNFLKNIKYKEVLFQGIFDGDGCAKVHKGILLSLSVDHTINYKPLIRELKLVTTSFFRNEIRLAPSSLKNLEKNIPAKAIINQIEFMIEAAKNSIRPDKVYGLIDIIKYISSNTFIIKCIFYCF